MTNPYISIILPIYNEEDRLPICMAHILDYFWHYTHWSFEVICVLNGCTDRSAEIALQFYENWTQVKILYLPEAGKGAAVRAGMLAATGSYRYMADVDLSTPISEIRRFIETAQHGNCLVAGVRENISLPPLRSATHAGFSALGKLLTGIPDTQCGFKLFRDSCARMVFERLKLTGYSFDVEALYLAKRLGFRVAPLAVEWQNEAHSKVSPISDGLRMLGDVIRIPAMHPVLP